MKKLRKRILLLAQIFAVGVIFLFSSCIRAPEEVNPTVPIEQGGGETGGGQTEEPGSGETGGEVTEIRTLKISDGKTDVAATKSADPLTITFASGENLVFTKGSANPRYDTSYVRFYAGGTLTINGSGKSISNISITLKPNNSETTNTFSANTGSIEDRSSGDTKLVWNAGETKPSSVVLTQSGSSGHYQISEIVITYGGTSGASSGTGGQTSETISVASVSFSPNASIISAGTTVSFSSATQNAEIYYSTKDALNSSNYSTATKGSSYTIPADTSETSIKISAIAVLTAADKTYFSSASSKTYTISKTGEIPSGGQGSGTDNTPLLLGNPTNATKDATQKENYLLEKTTYTISYNDTTHTPNWVAWHLDSSDLGDVSRGDAFAPDTSLPSGFLQIGIDYKFSTYYFDRGHMCPSGDRTSTSEKNKETFLMTNMIPQSPNNNQQLWQKLETYERDLLGNGSKELYIICGPYGQGGTSIGKDTNSVIKFSSSDWGKLKTVTHIPVTNPNNPDDKGIQVPAYTWRITVILDNGDNDISRITKDTQVIAVNIPNTYECRWTSTGEELSWRDYIVTVDELEALTKYDFFSALDPELQKVLQSKKYSN